MLMSFKGIAGLDFAVARNLGRKRKVRRVDHSRHRFGTEIAVEAAVVPYDPEFIFVGNLVADLLAACCILGDNSVELLMVKVSILAEVHIVGDILEHGTFVACLIFEVIHGKGLEPLCGEASVVELTFLADRNSETDIALLAAVNERRIDRGVRSKGHGHHFAGIVCKLYGLLKTVLRESKCILGSELNRKKLEKLVSFVVNVASLYPCAVVVRLILDNFVNSLVKKSVNVVVVGSLLVYGKVINRVGGFENAVSKSVREIERRKSPYLCRLPDGVCGIAVPEAEELDAVLIIAQADNIRTYLVGDESLITAC